MDQIKPVFFLIPIAFFLVVMTLLSIINYLSFAKLFNVKKKPYILFISIPTLLFTSFWITGIYTGSRPLISLGANSVALILIFTISLLLMLPISRFINHFDNEKGKSKVDLKRRNLIKTLIYIPPIVGAGLGLKGFKNSHNRIRIHKLPLKFKDLPEDLDGFRILHLTDLHIGMFTYMGELNNLVSRATSTEPDLVLITGDMCDYPPMLEKVIEVIKTLNPKYDFYGSLGNHDYIRGADVIIKNFNKNNIKMLVNDNQIIEVKNTRMLLTGIDDPQRLRGDTVTFLRRCLSEAIAKAPEASFKILLSHRPNGIVPASEYHYDLVLSGHTHGHQIGIFNKSIFEVMGVKGYYYGFYERDNTQLYVSGGMGHWFPFRLGIPQEATLVVLNKA
ncbi:MAG: metallophosphoesterase [Candidatus Coatesbacteria bacterium]|nr:metallophosphoesterase [Candidatus Coatesbacteria bacterium]